MALLDVVNSDQNVFEVIENDSFEFEIPGQMYYLNSSCNNV